MYSPVFFILFTVTPFIYLNINNFFSISSTYKNELRALFFYKVFVCRENSLFAYCTMYITDKSYPEGQSVSSYLSVEPTEL